MMKRFLHDLRGVSAVEFALIAPLLIVFYFATVQLDSALTAQRRVASVAGTVADLVAQDDVVDSAELAAIYESARAIMAPYDTANTIKVRVSSVRIGNQNRPRVVWSANRNWTSHNPGTEVSVPSNLIGGTSTVIMAETEFTYGAPLSDIIDRPLVMRETFFLRPRRAPQVCMKPQTGANIC